MSPDDQTNSGILISRDLFFGSKVTSTARELGFQVDMVADVAQTLAKVAEKNYSLLIVDLALPGLSISDLINGLPAENRPKVIAFGSHVHTTVLEEASAAGCDEVLPRSKFSATLPDLLRGYLGG